MLDIDYAELCNKWVVMDTHPELTRKPKNNKILNAIYIAGDMMGVDHKGLFEYLKRLAPRKSKTDGEKVAYFDNSYKYAGELLTTTSPGKFLKKVIPGVDDKIAEAFAIFWQNNVAFDPDDFIIHIGDTKEDFKEAFTNYRTAKGLTYDRQVKSISDSCMRHNFDSMISHPAETYASGDFFVVSVKDSNGKTRARAVVSNKTRNSRGEETYKGMFYNYIYAADDHSVSLIRSELGKLGAVFLSDNNFNGWNYLRLLAVKEILNDYWNEDHKHYIAPYIDGVRCCLLGEFGYEDDFIYIAREYEVESFDLSRRSPDTGGTVNMAQYEGYINLVTLPGLRVSRKK